MMTAKQKSIDPRLQHSVILKGHGDPPMSWKWLLDKVDPPVYKEFMVDALKLREQQLQLEVQYTNLLIRTVSQVG
jgi:hypothetical protein